jgi:hypothetical protein
MNSETNFEDKFRHVLNEMMQKFKKTARELSDQGADDEAVLETIRFNITEIFLRMFELSRSSNLPSQNPRIREIIEQYPNARNRAHKVFLYYLDSISRSWETSLKQANQFNDTETIMKETVKLELRDKIRSVYESLRFEARRDST